MEQESVTNHTAIPVRSSERYVILDVLRGLALLGIALANFPEFSLYSFLPVEATDAMPTAGTDRIVRYLQYIFIDGKFYTIFSLLFGIGFSIIITNAARKGANGFRIFYKRMLVLMLIGFLHLMFLWSGDILMLYALLGMLLPLFRNFSNQALLVWAFVLMAIPIAVDFTVELSGFYPSASVVELQQFYCNKYSITDENFAYWLRDAEYYSETFEFLIQGALVRVQEFIDGNRYFKVMGLFLLGFCIGRNRFYADLSNLMPQLKRIARYGFIIGLPLSFIYAWSAIERSSVGIGYARRTLFCQRISVGIRLRGRYLSLLPPPSAMESFSFLRPAGTHGTHQLYRAVGIRYVAFLRHRAWLRCRCGIGLCSSDCCRSMDCTGFV